MKQNLLRVSLFLVAIFLVFPGNVLLAQNLDQIKAQFEIITREQNKLIDEMVEKEKPGDRRGQDELRKQYVKDFLPVQNLIKAYIEARTQVEKAKFTLDSNFQETTSYESTFKSKLRLVIEDVDDLLEPLQAKDPHNFKGKVEALKESYRKLTEEIIREFNVFKTKQPIGNKAKMIEHFMKFTLGVFHKNEKLSGDETDDEDEDEDEDEDGNETEDEEEDDDDTQSHASSSTTASSAASSHSGKGRGDHDSDEFFLFGPHKSGKKHDKSKDDEKDEDDDEQDEEENDEDDKETNPDEDAYQSDDDADKEPDDDDDNDEHEDESPIKGLIKIDSKEFAAGIDVYEHPRNSLTSADATVKKRTIAADPKNGIVTIPDISLPYSYMGHLGQMRSVIKKDRLRINPTYVAIPGEFNKSLKNLKNMQKRLKFIKGKCTESKVREMIMMGKMEIMIDKDKVEVIPVRLVENLVEDSVDKYHYIKVDDFMKMKLKKVSKDICAINGKMMAKYLLEKEVESIDYLAPLAGAGSGDEEMDFINGHLRNFKNCENCQHMEDLQNVYGFFANVAKIVDSMGTGGTSAETDLRNKKHKLTCMLETYYESCGVDDSLEELREFRKDKNLGACNTELRHEVIKDDLELSRELHRAEKWEGLYGQLNIKKTDFGMDETDDADYERNLNDFVKDPDLLKQKLPADKKKLYAYLKELNEMTKYENKKLEEDKGIRFEQKLDILEQFLAKGKQDPAYLKIVKALGNNKKELQVMINTHHKDKAEMDKIKKAFYQLNVRIKDFEARQQSGELLGNQESQRRLKMMNEEQQARKERLKKIKKVEGILLAKAKEVDSGAAPTEDDLHWTEVSQERESTQLLKKNNRAERLRLETEAQAELEATKFNDMFIKKKKSPTKKKAEEAEEEEDD